MWCQFHLIYEYKFILINITSLREKESTLVLTDTFLVALFCDVANAFIFLPQYSVNGFLQNIRSNEIHSEQ